MTNRIPRSLVHGAMVASLFLAGACKGKETSDTAAGDVATPSTTPAATAVPNADVDVDNLSLGRTLGADNKIADGTTEFSTRDTVIAVVETDHAPAGAQLVARWTFGDTDQPVAEQTETIASTDDARTVFRLTKATAWPAGKYHLRVMSGDRELAKKDFDVK
jgi:hypothetical protein